ncbi:MAG TPA: class I SAM-dependent methyltransferase [Thermoanaerobaculia bacterium]|nr:class I SAM-dependent methyltransferase [Thermoanaerobaculia bacterium]
MASGLAFDPREIPEFYGPGPAGNHLPQYAGRKELWQYSLSLVEDDSRNWCELGVGEGESLDWFASRKPRCNLLFAFDSFEGLPEPWLVYPAGHWKTRAYVSNRPDLIVVAGLFEDTLTEEVVHELGVVGLMHIDCDLYSSTRTVFERVGRLVQPGTVIIFDELYNYFGWEQHEMKAFAEFADEHRIEVELLGRTPSCQVSLRVVRRGRRCGATVRPCTWTPTCAGVGIR